MLSLRTISFMLNKCTGSIRNFNRNPLLQRCAYCTKSKTNDLSNKQNSLGEIGAKYQIFEDKDADVIFDVYEEKLKYQDLLDEVEEEEHDPFNGLNLESRSF